MYKDSRLQQIMNILNSVGKIKTSELATKIYVSQSTLRRDLVLLEKQNMISRKFGYVSLLGKANLEFPYFVREQENVKGKKYICEKAASFITNNMAVFLDSSSTTSFIPDYLFRKNKLVFITNGLLHAYKLSKLENVTLYTLGGHNPRSFGGTVGSDTIAQINNYNTNLAIVSFGSLLNDSVYITDKEQANFRLAMIANAKESLLLMDSSKFEQSDFIKASTLKIFKAIISDKKPPKDTIKYCNKHDIEVIW